jgi:hypothetical protein
MKILERKYELIKRDPLGMEFDRQFRAWRKGRNINPWGKSRKEHPWIDIRDILSYRDLVNLAIKLETKWAVNIYTNGYHITGLPAFVIGGPMEDSWEITGLEPTGVEIGKWASYSGFGDLVECPQGKIPIIIDLSVLTLNDARKIKKVVWDIVEKEIRANREYRKAEANRLSNLHFEEIPENCREGYFVYADGSKNKEIKELEEHREKFCEEPRKLRIAQLKGPRIPSHEPPELAAVFHNKAEKFKQYLR